MRDRLPQSLQDTNRQVRRIRRGAWISETVFSSICALFLIALTICGTLWLWLTQIPDMPR